MGINTAEYPTTPKLEQKREFLRQVPVCHIQLEWGKRLIMADVGINGILPLWTDYSNLY